MTNEKSGISKIGIDDIQNILDEHFDFKQKQKEEEFDLNIEEFKYIRSLNDDKCGIQVKVSASTGSDRDELKYIDIGALEKKIKDVLRSYDLGKSCSSRISFYNYFANDFMVKTQLNIDIGERLWGRQTGW